MLDCTNCNIKNENNDLEMFEACLRIEEEIRLIGEVKELIERELIALETRILENIKC